jgi:UDP-N-acetylmuramate--alanine ligase
MLRTAMQEFVKRMDSRPVSRFAGQRIHFIGIGGCGMCGLARIMLDSGAVISGTDCRPTPPTQALAGLGASITYTQDGSTLSGAIDLVVRTAAVPEHNPEYQAARRLNLPQLKYAEMLGLVMSERLGIAISGTHGKSTTTAMASYALFQCGADPSYVIGGTVGQLGGSSRSGAGQAFVVEACEFDRSFHNYCPRVAIITNIEADHLDCYRGGLEEIIESFRAFAGRVPAGGRIIANGQDANVRRALEGSGAPVEWVGIEADSALTWSTRCLGHVAGGYRGEVHHQGRKVAELRLALPGIHNLFNATMAVAACSAAGVGPSEAARALCGFLGVDRRMTEMGRHNGALVVDDYGHHPTEIRTTLRAAREKYAPRRLICVFQPHQYSRTRYFLEDFAHSFEDADLTVLPDIYAARDTEDDRRSVAVGDLVARIRRNGQAVVHLPTLPQIAEYLKGEAREGDVIITMGAGNICDVGRELISG